MISEKKIKKLQSGDDADALVAELCMGYRYYGGAVSKFDAILDSPIPHHEGWDAEYVRIVATGAFLARSPDRLNHFTTYDVPLVAEKYGIVVYRRTAGELPAWYPEGEPFLAIVYGRGYKRTDATGPTEALAICRAALLAVVRRQRRLRRKR